MFYIGNHRIDPPFLLAPMAGVSEMPFRVLAFEYGAGLATTELVSAKGIHCKNKRTRKYLTYNKEKERPYSIQLFGGDLTSMTQAAIAAVEHGADIIDINMGCPVKKVTKTGAGSALLCDMKRAASLVESMRIAVANAVPITVKIRSGWDEKNINCVEMAKALEDAGCAAIALHARTKAQGYSGQANWNLIRELKNAVKMPVIGNGDVVTIEDALRMKGETGCDGVMIGRGALGKPWIFRALKDGNETAHEGRIERRHVILKHLQAHIEFHLMLEDHSLEQHARALAIRTFRSHLAWYASGLRGAAKFRERVMHLTELNEVEDAIDEFFLEAEACDIRSNSPENDGIDYRQAFG